MSTDEQDRGPSAPGGVPHAFGQALAWRWTRQMPATCKGGFLTMLYALRQMAAPSGELRFQADRKPLKITDLAKAAGCREKDGRRYIEAAIRAGVVVVVGERTRGKATLYQLVVNPVPSWGAAADYLRATARSSSTTFQPAGSSGHGGPNSQGQEFGPQRPELPDDAGDEVRATVARRGSGHGGPTGSGHGGPNIPCVTHAGSHDGVEVVPPVPVPAGARGQDDQSPQQAEDTDRPFRRCSCGVPLVRTTKDLCGGCERAAASAQEGPSRPVQGAFLIPVPGRPGQDRSAAPAAVYAPRSDAVLRVCGCGREYRHPDVRSVCPDCAYAAELEAAGAVSGV